MRWFEHATSGFWKTWYFLHFTTKSKTLKSESELMRQESSSVDFTFLKYSWKKKNTTGFFVVVVVLVLLVAMRGNTTFCWMWM